MKLVHRHCAGLDVHTGTVVACARRMVGKRVQQEVRTFGTTVRELLELAEWLEGQKVSHVVMEATGVYWKPVWHVLEGRFELVLANAAHVRNVPGRKTDVNDATWLAELLAHGLIRGSFVPPQPIQELRELTRTRRQLVRQVVQHTLRIQKTLQDANIKLREVIRDVLGVSGRAMLEALASGETDPEKLADLGKPGLKASRAELVEALRGRVTLHHRFLLRLHLQQVDALREGIQQVEIRIQELIEPFRERIDRLEQIPGVSTVVAQVIIGEIGIDMSRFPTHSHLISWAGLCPRMDESAGKRGCTRVRKSNSWLKPALVQAAWGAARTKEGYLHAQFLRLRSRRGPKKAIVAVAASILTAVYFMLRDDVQYKDLGGDYFSRQNPEHLVRRLARRIERLGYQVRVERAA